jgi:hypothetical protein
MCAVALLSLAGAQGAIITFDDLPAVGCGGTPLPSSYAGLTWNGWGYDNATLAPCSTSGYGTALTSSPNVAFDLAGGVEGATDSITSGSPFILLSGDFAGAWNDGLTITVTGKLFGSTVGTVSFLVNTTTRTLETFGFGPVTELDFSGAGGTLHAGAAGSGWQFGLDNLTTIPEPGTFFLMGTAILCLSSGILVRNRRKASTHSLMR